MRKFIEANLLFGESTHITDGSSLLGRGILDSTSVVEVISFLETEYSISFDDSELVADNFDSIDRIATFVDSKLR
ncbi:MAG: acyl carrier protein [Ilumatobacteraceae bacterium]